MNNLLTVSRKENDSTELPDRVADAQGLMNFLARRSDTWRKFLAVSNALTVTVNKQFTETFTTLEHGDKVAPVPTSNDLQELHT